MKATTYIFGNFADGYSQYPDDYTRDLFANVSKSRKGATELVYHREGALTYYIYTHEISRSANTFIGLCYVFNDILITDFSCFFDIFEDTITNIVVKGEILEFTNDGNLSTKVNQLYTSKEELQRISDYLNNKLTALGRYTQKLPPINYAASNTEWKSFSFDEISEVKTIIKYCPNIRVIKGENYDTDTLKGYAHQLKTQNTQIKNQAKEISNLTNEIATLKRQKKQIKWVVLLLLLIIIGCIIFYLYAQNSTQVIKDQTQLIQEKTQLIKNQKQLIREKSDTINNLNREVRKQKYYISNLRNDSISLSNELYKKTNQYINLQNDSIKLSKALSQKTNQYNTVTQKLSNIHSILDNNVSKYLYFNSWESTNYHKNSSTSSITYYFYAYKDDRLSIPYYVSSEKSYDFLTIKLKRNGYSTQQLLKESGIKSGTYTHTFDASDSYQLIVSYSKDHNNDRNDDNAGVKQFYIYRPIVNQLLQMSTITNK